MPLTIDLVCKVGPYAGQLLTYPKDVGETLLATGQAEYPAPGGAARVLERATMPVAQAPEKPKVRSSRSKK